MSITKISNSTGYIIFTTIFIVLAGFSVVESLQMALTPSMAPQNLLRSAELFKGQLRVEKPDFPVQEMVSTGAWAELETTLSDYTQRLELLNRQRRTRFIAINTLLLLSAIGMLAHSLRDRKPRVVV